MGQTLTHGIYLPDEGERNCYNGLAANWSILDGAVGTIAEHTSALAGKAPLVHTHTKADITDLLNSNFIPSANNSYDLGSSSYQWNNLYAKNYYYNGTIFTDKFVTTDTLQTISAEKKFTMGFSLKNTAVTSHTTAPSSETNSHFLFIDGNDRYWGSYAFYWITDGTTETRLQHTNYSTSGGQGWWQIAFGATKDFNNVYFRPSSNATINLGTSTNKWKTLNGLNPGALSLPDVFDSYDVVTTNWSTAYNQPNNLQINGANPSYPGWLFIKLDNCTAENDFIIVRYYNTNQVNLTFFGSFLPRASAYVLCVPIQAGITTKVWVSQLPTYCKYYACLGAVK